MIRQVQGIADTDLHMQLRSPSLAPAQLFRCFAISVLCLPLGIRQVQGVRGLALRILLPTTAGAARLCSESMPCITFSAGFVAWWVTLVVAGSIIRRILDHDKVLGFFHSAHAEAKGLSSMGSATLPCLMDAGHVHLCVG